MIPTIASPPGQPLPPRHPARAANPEASGHVKDLLSSSLILEEDWRALSSEVRAELLRCPDLRSTLKLLVKLDLLTEYQAGRIEAGTIFGLVLGNYRVLDRLGAGGMGVVFKAEHTLMRRLVAIKVLPQSAEQDDRMLQRFLSEMRSSARLLHPNIVSALDAGTILGVDPNTPKLHYFVMEYVPGQDLEALVQAHGPFAPAKACEIAYQVACALAVVAKHGLVHRDVKPSNVLVTPAGEAKLLDFGLARHFHSGLPRPGLTCPGMMLGTADYMAPEQAKDATTVDARTDIYGLGGTLFWCLTGRVPFPSQGSMDQDLARRMTEKPPMVRTWRPEIPEELDTVVAYMLAANRENRYATPEAAMHALLPFIESKVPGDMGGLGSSGYREALPGIPDDARPTPNVLIVDDEPVLRRFCRLGLESIGVQCEEATDGSEALQALQQKRYDLLVLDVDMPQLSGIDVLQQLRKHPPYPHLKIIMVSGKATADEMAQLLVAGADDYLAKPYSLAQLKARIKASLRLKEAQDKAIRLNQQLATVNAELERRLASRGSEAARANNALVLILTKLVELRDVEKASHLARLGRYCRCLAEAAMQLPYFTDQLNPEKAALVEWCAPLHDLGKIALPDHIVLKPGKLDATERVIMESHASIGADILQQAAERHNWDADFLDTAMEIVRHHHERFDGTGYPDRLKGDAIPLAARIVALADSYDALRSRRTYRPGLSHAVAMQSIMRHSPGHFDPRLAEAFEKCAEQFDLVFREAPD
jgi:response regulator RpfG family c-di-GMP phosphodiesterase